MSEIRFDGRVAIVTGAGGAKGLGRQYALQLAERGAKVVVNDLGVGPDGRGTERPAAELVVEEITARGGEAVADTNSVADEEGAKAVVRTAMDAWGRVDVLVNNAGVALVALFDEVSGDEARKMIDVHLMGNLWMSRAVWPHMVDAGYGRIVNITSDAALGMKYNVVYGAAKGGVLALARGLAIEGADHGIKVNALGPTAGTSASALFIEPSPWLTRGLEELRTDLVSPVLTYLCSSVVEASGKYIETQGGKVMERFYSETVGLADPALTPEWVRDNFARICDRADATAMPDPRESGTDLDPKPYQPA